MAGPDAAGAILVLNAGSSSIKCALFDAALYRLGARMIARDVQSLMEAA